MKREIETKEIRKNKWCVANLFPSIFIVLMLSSSSTAQETGGVNLTLKNETVRTTLYTIYTRGKYPSAIWSSNKLYFLQDIEPGSTVTFPMPVGVYDICVETYGEGLLGKSKTRSVLWKSYNTRYNKLLVINQDAWNLFLTAGYWKDLSCKFR